MYGWVHLNGEYTTGKAWKALDYRERNKNLDNREERGIRGKTVSQHNHPVLLIVILCDGVPVSLTALSGGVGVSQAIHGPPTTQCWTQRCRREEGELLQVLYEFKNNIKLSLVCTFVE